MWREILAEKEQDADIGVFSISVDDNASIGKGAARAPIVIREKSEFLPPYTIDGSEIKTRIFDYGDVDEFDYDAVLKMMKQALKTKFTIMLGGDHSVSILSERAFREIEGGHIGIIHIDAHADICDIYNGSQNSHACVNRRAIENGYQPQDISMVGIRSYERQEVEYLSGHPVKIFTSDDVRRLGADNISEQLIQKYSGYDALYLSFDIDAVDPAYAPGTGTPEAFGLTSLEVLTIMTELLEKLPVRVMDIVEVSPPLDSNYITVWLALKYILEVIKKIESNRK